MGWGKRRREVGRGGRQSPEALGLGEDGAVYLHGGWGTGIKGPLPGKAISSRVWGRERKGLESRCPQFTTLVNAEELEGGGAPITTQSAGI